MDRRRYRIFNPRLYLKRDAGATMAPVDQWSKMTFESYIDNNWEIYFANGDFTNLVRLMHDGAMDIHPRLNRGTTRIAFGLHPVRKWF